eukprot:scaffold672_cov126-Cylindrotheca_fusiformis.AAC.10
MEKSLHTLSLSLHPKQDRSPHRSTIADSSLLQDGHILWGAPAAVASVAGGKNAAVESTGLVIAFWRSTDGNGFDQ